LKAKTKTDALHPSPTWPVAYFQSQARTDSRQKKLKQSLRNLTVALIEARGTESEVDETHQELKQQISVADYHNPCYPSVLYRPAPITSHPVLSGATACSHTLHYPKFSRPRASTPQKVNSRPNSQTQILYWPQILFLPCFRLLGTSSSSFSCQSCFGFRDRCQVGASWREGGRGGSEREEIARGDAVEMGGKGALVVIEEDNKVNWCCFLFFLFLYLCTCNWRICPGLYFCFILVKSYRCFGVFLFVNFFLFIIILLKAFIL